MLPNLNLPASLKHNHIGEYSEDISSALRQAEMDNKAVIVRNIPGRSGSVIVFPDGNVSPSTDLNDFNEDISPKRVQMVLANMMQCPSMQWKEFNPTEFDPSKTESHHRGARMYPTSGQES